MDWQNQNATLANSVTTARAPAAPSLLELPMPDPSTVVWDDWLLLAVQVLGLIFLIVYVVKTWQMATATRQAAEASATAVQQAIDARLEALAPRIVVYFGTTSLMAEIVIRNVGGGTAEDLTLAFEPPLQTTEFHDTNKFFATPQPMVPPGFDHAQTFDTWPRYVESELPKRYVVTARYRGAENGRTYESRYVLDVESVRYRLLPHDKVEVLRDAIKSLEKAVSDSLRELRNETIPLLRFNGLSAFPRNSLPDAVAELLGTWTMMNTVDTSANAYYPFRSMIELLRTQALNLSWAMARTDATPSQITAVESLCAHLFSIDAELLGNRTWHLERGKIFEAVQHAFTATPGATE